MEKTTLPMLIDLVKNCSAAGKRYCFILGAGASRSSGIKTGAEMAEIWLEELERLEGEATKEWIEKEKIEKDNLGAYYPKIYGRRFRLDPADGFIRLQKEMEDAIPSPGYYHLAKILAGTSNKLVITTNFDSLTENSLFIYEDKKALVITHESLAQYIDAFANRPTVIKLHRDLLLQPKNDEAAVNSLPKEWGESLKKIMEIYIPIVIGYGGNDGSLMGFLDEVSSKGRYIYWCYKTDSSPNEQITKLLEKYNGFLVSIDNFDDTMQAFGKAFDFDFSEETIRDTYNKRAQKLIAKYREQETDRLSGLSEKEKEKTLSSTESMTLDNLKSAKEKRIESFLAQIAQDPKNAKLHYDLGREYFWDTQYDKAIEYFTNAIDLEPDKTEHYLWRSASYNWLKDFSKAVADCTSAIELEPDKAKYYYNRGINYGWLKEYEKNIADYSKAIELEPNNATFYTALARVLCKAGYVDRALDYMNRAIKLDINFPDCYNTRGYINLKIAKRAGAKCDPSVLSDLNKAIGAIEAIEKKDDTLLPRFYTDRAEYFLYSGDLDNAHSDLQKALAIYSHYGRTHYFLAKYYEAKGNKKEYENYMAKSKEYRFIPDNDD
jgi:pentatricopeptide repeat protein